MTEDSWIDQLQSLLGADAVLSPQTGGARGFGTDASKIAPQPFRAVALPSTSDEVRALVRWAEERRIPLVPAGGRTGYSGGAVATEGAVVVALERMNRILDFDPAGGSMAVEAGVVTADLARAARNQGLYFPIDFAATDRSQVGGNVSTNAGGLRVLRYGTMRDQVLGLAAITGGGAQLGREFGLRKSSSGPEPWRLLVGAEGILGVVCEVEVKLVAPSEPSAVALFAVEGLATLLELSALARRERVALLSFELFDAVSLREVRAARGWDLPHPSIEAASFVGLVEAEVERKQDAASFARWLAVAESLSLGCAVARDETSHGDLWRYRRAISESLGERQQVHKNDLAVPLARLAALAQGLGDLAAKLPCGVELALFGHVGDGNLHVNLLRPHDLEPARFAEVCREFDRESYALVAKLGGSVSAEHGIGLAKRHVLALGRSAEDLAILQAVKKAFDPARIFNPGKVIS